MGNKVCETKPIPPEREEEQVLDGKRVMMNSIAKGLRQNKANSPPQGREWAGPTRPANAATVPVVQDKANCPRMDRNGRGLAELGKEPLLGINRAKQSQFGLGRNESKCFVEEGL